MKICQTTFSIRKLSNMCLSMLPMFENLATNVGRTSCVGRGHRAPRPVYFLADRALMHNSLSRLARRTGRQNAHPTKAAQLCQLPYFLPGTLYCGPGLKQEGLRLWDEREKVHKSLQDTSCLKSLWMAKHLPTGCQTTMQALP